MFKKITAFVILLTLCLPFAAFSSSQAIAGTWEVDIFLPGHSPEFIGDKPLMISGILNVVNITYSNTFETFSLQLYPGDDEPDVKNETNFYRWDYTDGDFDCFYDEYIDLSMSVKTETNIKFVIGTSVLVNTGDWTLDMISDGVKSSVNIFMDIPKAGIGVSAPDFYFTTAPFSGEDFHSSEDRNYVRTMNTGNIPLNLKITYDNLEDYIKTTNTTGIFGIGQERYHHLSFETPIWGPRRIVITGSVTGEPLYAVNPTTVQLIPIPQIPFKLTIEIVRPGFRLQELGDVTIQYRQTASVQYEHTTDLQIYLTGTGTLTVTSATDQLSLESTTYRGARVGESVNIVLSNDTEEEVIYTIKGTHPNAVGELLYTLSWGDNEEIIFTEVTTGPAPEGEVTEDTERDLYGLIFVFVVIAVAAIVLFFISRNKGGEESERERKRREWLERHKGREI